MKRLYLIEDPGIMAATEAEEAVHAPAHVLVQAVAGQAAVPRIFMVQC